jgi:prepilin-type N-terminal cleavage/methylation domain-containing protein
MNKSRMNRPSGSSEGHTEEGFSLVELLVAMTAASLLILALYRLDLLTVKVHTEVKDEWYCMQSLRAAAFQLNDDLIQAGCLLPRDLLFAVENNDLFIAGIPVTSLNPGVQPSLSAPLPYYAMVVSARPGTATVDTVDIDGNGKEDFWADLGMITDRGPGIISHNYARGSLTISVTTLQALQAGTRMIPAIHYTLKQDGLHRNGQLLAEAVFCFEPKLGPHELTILLRSRHHGKEKELLLSHSY